MSPVKSTARKMITSLLAIVFCVQSLTAATFLDCHCRRASAEVESQAGCSHCSVGESSAETSACCQLPIDTTPSEKDRVHCLCGPHSEPTVPGNSNVVTYNWDLLIAASIAEAGFDTEKIWLDAARRELANHGFVPSVSLQILCCTWQT
ncbi:hypothetical protein Mal48_14750 [Thalassoglobus polymorphus]|uniref:Uncharacterized protein n=1 Tax=Thalassoglobus polymorphus TaxID=2527994 RepID=A0A517QKQ8_9PLAN|nr:hypothetical protein Mal48_14750 [Thalassoglobus polymorphus]